MDTRLLRTSGLAAVTIMMGLLGDALAAAPRQVWQIGENAPPGASGSALHGEFSQENGRNDAPPGLVTRVPGDPQYNSGNNPGADNDYYFAGNYPAGFNQLGAPLAVPFDEPWTAWERAHTVGDRTNRMHFHLDAAQVTGGGTWTLRAEYASGGFMINGVVQSGFATHDLVVRFRNGSGAATQLYSGRLTSATELVLNFTPGQVNATAGPNSIEFVRTGPAQSGYSYWLIYDYVQLSAPAGNNAAPIAAVVPDQNLPELTPLALNLNGPRLNQPGTIAYAFGDSITAGASASPASVNSWLARAAESRGWPLTNLAYSSACIPDINWQLMPGFRVTNNSFHGGQPVRSPDVIAPTQASMLLTGYNDGRDGFGRPTQTAYQNFYRSSLRHAAAYLAIPTSRKTYAQAASASGTWQPYAQFGGNMGRTATANGSTLTFSGLSGSAIYIGYLATAQTDMGSFTVTVDGIPRGVVPCTGAFGNRNARHGNPSSSPIPHNVGTSGDGRIWASPLLYRISGLSEGAHTVVVTATVSPHPVTILWAAGSASARAGLSRGDGPSVWVGGTLKSTPVGYLVGSEEGMAVLTGIQSEICAELAGDGLHVQHVRAGDYFDPSTGMWTDNVHPNNVGHAQIATAFIEKFVAPGSDAETPSGALTYSLLNGPSGMTVSSDGRLSWTPTEAQGPSTQTVRVRVTDAGPNPQSATSEFSVSVREVNAPPVPQVIPDRILAVNTSLTMQLSANDPDLPPNSLTYQLLSGPPGLQITPGGFVTWSPGSGQQLDSYPVEYRVTDNGTPPLSATGEFTVVLSQSAPEIPEVPEAPEAPQSPGTIRSVWTIGVNAPPNITGGALYAEFSPQNNINDLPPGAVTRIPGDPQYNPANNPGADDDHYFAGVYPAGFNRLTQPLTVPFDEPDIAWERAHTLGDRTNRFHFHLHSTQAAATTVLRLAVEFAGGGWMINGVVQPGFADHDMVIRFRNGAGMATQIYAGRISRQTELILDFTASSVSATSGANSIEVVRTGPLGTTGYSYCIQYDYMELSVPESENPGLGSSAPTRNDWQLGFNAPPSAPVSSTYAEFSEQNHRNDAPPGLVTRIPGDPQFNPAANPTADNDFYFAGIYPAGFNGLTAPLNVPNDEPFSAWERALSIGDRTNRAHFILSPTHTAAGARLRLSFEFPGGALAIGGVVQPGFSEHDMVVRFRNSAGVSTVVYANRVSAPTEVSLEFLASALGATPGPNTLEFVRTGPVGSGVSYWILFDYVRIQSLVGSTSPSVALTSGPRPAAAGIPIAPAAPPAYEVSLGTVESDSERHLTITYTRPNPPPAGWVDRAEASEDLLNWFPTPTTVLNVESGDGWQTVTLQDDIPLPEDGSRFLRIRGTPQAWIPGTDEGVTGR